MLATGKDTQDLFVGQKSDGFPRKEGGRFPSFSPNVSLQTGQSLLSQLFMICSSCQFTSDTKKFKQKQQPSKLDARKTTAIEVGC